MSGLQGISISLATYKAIEAQRISFNETHDVIIRRALAERTSRRRMPHERRESKVACIGRKRGNMTVQIAGQSRAVLNLKDAYLVILSALVRHKASLFQLLSVEGTLQRRWIAASPHALYITSPHLADDFAHEIAPNWFVDTNVSRGQIISRLTTACTLAGYKYGRDVMITEG